MLNPDASAFENGGAGLVYTRIEVTSLIVVGNAAEHDETTSMSVTNASIFETAAGGRISQFDSVLKMQEFGDVMVEVGLNTTKPGGRADRLQG